MTKYGTQTTFSALRWHFSTKSRCSLRILFNRDSRNCDQSQLVNRMYTVSNLRSISTGPFYTGEESHFPTITAWQRQIRYANWIPDLQHRRFPQTPSAYPDQFGSREASPLFGQPVEVTSKMPLIPNTVSTYPWTNLQLLPWTGYTPMFH